MEAGALICTPRSPVCLKCPLKKECRGYRSGRPSLLPIKRPRKQVPHFDVAAAVIRQKKKILITRRPEKGLLGRSVGISRRGKKNPESPWRNA